MRKTPAVLGVLSMVFGGIVVLFSGIQLAAQSFTKQLARKVGDLPQREGEPNVGEFLERAAKVAEELKVYTYLTNGIMLVLSIALVVVGIMLYQRRPQSRPAAVTWAIAALAYLPLQLILYMKIVAPRMADVTKQAMQGMDPSIAQGYAAAQGPAAIIATTLLFTPFPVVLLALMGRRSAKNDLIAVP